MSIWYDINDRVSNAQKLEYALVTCYRAVTLWHLIQCSCNFLPVIKCRLIQFWDKKKCLIDTAFDRTQASSSNIIQLWVWTISKLSSVELV